MLGEPSYSREGRLKQGMIDFGMFLNDTALLCGIEMKSSDREASSRTSREETKSYLIPYLEGPCVI